MIKNIILIYGGMSGEYEVSCVSARFLEKTLNQSGFNVLPVFVDQTGSWHLQKSVNENPQQHIKNPCYIIQNNATTLFSSGQSFPVDFVFPIIHGTTGEDGKLQGFLEFLNIPYAGSGVLTSAICMDKFYSKTIFMNAKIPMVRFQEIERHHWDADQSRVIAELKKTFAYPLFIKPSNMGSSVGVSRVVHDQDLVSAIQTAFLYDSRILCEVGLSVREVEVSILGNFPDYKVSIAGEIVPNHKFYSYEAKYLDKNGASLVIPAKLTDSQYNEIQQLAKLAFQSVNGDGFARIDFFIDKNSQKIYLNEINTLPGLTPISMFPILWEKSGLQPAELVKKIVELGVEKFTQRKILKTSRLL